MIGLAIAQNPSQAEVVGTASVVIALLALVRVCGVAVDWHATRATPTGRSVRAKPSIDHRLGNRDGLSYRIGFFPCGDLVLEEIRPVLLGLGDHLRGNLRVSREEPRQEGIDDSRYGCRDEAPDHG